MGLCTCVAKFATALILLGINFVLAIGGAVVLYIGVSLRSDAWVSVLAGYWSGTDDVLTAIIVVGAVVIGLAALGSIAACCRWRLGLLIYAWIVFLLMLVFLAVAIAAFVLRSTANDWEDSEYPASSDEESVKEKFDAAYCYAQGEYMCNEMTVKDVFQMFLPSLDSSVASLFDNYTGINSLCDEVGSFVSVVPDLETVCDACAIAEQFTNLSSILDWANDKCPRTNGTLVWCGEYLASGSASIGTAPYTECREEFLDFVETRALWTGIGGIVVVAGALMVIGFSCFLRHKERRERRGRDDDDGPVTPMTTTAHAQGQYDKV